MSNGSSPTTLSKRELLKEATFWDLVSFVFLIVKILNTQQWPTQLLAFMGFLFKKLEKL